MKYRVVIERLGTQLRAPAKVFVEAQDGTTPGFGQASYFETISEADTFARGVEKGLRVAGAWDAGESIHDAFWHNVELAARMQELCDNYELAKRAAESEARQYRFTAPPSSVHTIAAMRNARRWRLALWVLGRDADARTVSAP